MHCLKCDYPLWNLAPGSCPECGTQFKPTDCEFPVGQARFCCPDCDQAYYGDGPEGHLQPSEFECVSCNRHLTEDDCIIRPLEGEDEIASRVAPWFQPNLGLFSRFFRTCGWAMVRPVQLANGTPLANSTVTAMGFMALIQFLGLAIGAFPLLAIALAAPLISGNGMGFGVAMLGVLLFAGGSMLSSIVIILLNACVAHLVLACTGRLQHGLGRTVTLCCLGSGPAILVAIPCLGPYCGSYVSGVWMIVSTILVVAHGHRVAGWRASIAVLALPFILLVALGIAAVLFLNISSVLAPVGTRMLPPGSGAIGLGGGPALSEDHTDAIAEALQIFMLESDPESPEVFLTAVDRLVPGLLPVGTADLISIDGNGFRGWRNSEMLLLTVPGTGAILVIPTVEDMGGRRFQIVEVYGMLESSTKIAAEDLRGDLVRRLDSFGARGRDLASAQIRGWVDSL